MAILPPVSPNTPKETRFSLQGFIEPARDVGDDFFDYTLQDNKRHLIIGDVSDKGVPAALFMAITISLLRSAATTLSDPSLILAHVNKGLSQYNNEALFVTVFYGILDLESGELIYSLGGAPCTLCFLTQRRRNPIATHLWGGTRDWAFVHLPESTAHT